MPASSTSALAPSSQSSSSPSSASSSSASAVAAKSTKIKDLHATKVLSDASIRYNDYLLDYCQTSMSALSGCTAGVIGLTGLYGFLFYLVCSLSFSLLILAYLGSTCNKYFLSKQNIVTGTLWSGIQTYLLFWTFLFGMVHVY